MKGKWIQTPVLDQENVECKCTTCGHRTEVSADYVGDDLEIESFCDQCDSQAIFRIVIE